MRRWLGFALAGLWLGILPVGGALADTASVLKEIQALKERIAELEQRLEEQEQLAKRRELKAEKVRDEKIAEALEERF